MTTPLQTPHDWSKDALLTKAQRYAEEMLSHPRDDWKFAFWSSLTLELLARAALANVSPALLADSKDWNNVYFALGNGPKAAKFSPKSVDITSVLARLRDILPDFTPGLENFSVVHMGRRNEELHSATTAFDSVNISGWLPIYYQACDVLLTSMEENLEALVGTEEADIAITMMAAAKDESAKAVGKTIEAHKTIWAQKDAAEQAQLQLQATAWATRQAGHRVKCPSCNAEALLTGAPVAAPNKSLDDDQITETQYFLPSKFECVACGLKISTLPQLHAAGLGDTYKSTITYDAAEYFRSRDEYLDYEPDFNEP
jgi:hypothetical protein